MKEEQNNKHVKKWYQKLGAKILAGLGVIALIIAILTGIIDLKKELKKEKKENQLEVENPTLKDTSSTNRIGPSGTIVSALDSKIKKLVEEARKDKGISIENANAKFTEAYNLLPDSLKNSKFIRTVKNSSSFETQVEYLDSFFIHLNIKP